MPTLAFAEKGPAAGKPEPQKAAVQDIVPAKADNAIASGKAASESAVKNLAKEKTSPVKTGTIPLQPAKSKGEVQSTLNKDVNATKAPLPKASKTGKRDQAKKIAKPDNPKGKQAAVKSIHISDNVKVVKHGSPGLKDQVEAVQEPNAEPVITKKPAPKVTVQKPVTQVESKESSENQKDPKGETSPAIPSRTKAAAGPSSDRTSNGNTSISFSDKWFVWDHYFNLITSKSFTSRAMVFRSQWVNAPPSPPPVAAPVFIPYTDAIRHG